MELERDTSGTYPASRLLANAAMIVGCGWLVTALWLTFQTHRSGRLQGAASYEFTLALAWFLLSGPGLACFTYGRRLHRLKSIARVRLATGALALATVIGTLYVSFFVFRFGWLPPNTRSGLLALGSVAVIAFIIYVLVCRQILLHDRFATLGYSDVLTRPLLWSFTFYVWIVCVIAIIAKYANSTGSLAHNAAGILGWSVGASACALWLYWGLGRIAGHRFVRVLPAKTELDPPGQ